MNNIINFFRPIKEAFTFFLIIWITSTITDVIPAYATKDYRLCIYIAMGSSLFSFIISLFTSIITKEKLRNILQYSIFIYFLVYNFVNLYCIYILKSPSIVNIASIIANSNLNEVQEFISHAVKPLYYLLGLIIFSFLIFLFSQIIKIKVRHGFFPLLLGTLLLLCSIYTTIHKPWILSETSHGKTILSFKTIIDSPPQLSNFLTNPAIQETHHYHPQNIVIIIGESYSKHHSSLYGYEKQTNPLLAQEKLLYIYKNTISPATHTIDAFKAFMSTYSPDRHSDDMWYRMPTIPEVFNIAGYHSIWISNQNRKGFYENIPSKYSELCHKAIFINERDTTHSYDIDILNEIKELTNNHTKNIYFIHLMGQHVTFESRYPSSFKKFQSEDYEEYPEHQRSNRANYDNATLYNDFVVHSIIQEFSNKETILFYFSDHGLDIYDTSNTYCGHANSSKESIKFGKQIPFMIYTSPSFVQAYSSSDIIQKLQMRTKQEYCIDDIIYTIMDIAGYKFKNNTDVETYSLFAQ